MVEIHQPLETGYPTNPKNAGVCLIVSQCIVSYPKGFSQHLQCLDSMKSSLQCRMLAIFPLQKREATITQFWLNIKPIELPKWPIPSNPHLPVRSRHPRPEQSSPRPCAKFAILTVGATALGREGLERTPAGQWDEGVSRSWYGRSVGRSQVWFSDVFGEGRQHASWRVGHWASKALLGFLFRAMSGLNWLQNPKEQSSDVGLRSEALQTNVG